MLDFNALQAKPKLSNINLTVSMWVKRGFINFRLQLTPIFEYLFY
jgi:hypothetical protein